MGPIQPPRLWVSGPLSPGHEAIYFQQVQASKYVRSRALHQCAQIQRDYILYGDV
jgi:hypothetical protein